MISGTKRPVSCARDILPEETLVSKRGRGIDGTVPIWTLSPRQLTLRAHERVLKDDQDSVKVLIIITFSSSVAKKSFFSRHVYCIYIHLI